jgi:hypothetical protein
MNIEHLLYDEIETEFEKLREYVPGTSEHKAIVDELAILMQTAIKMEQANNDCQDKAETRENDLRVKQEQFDKEQAMKQQQFESEQTMKQQQLLDEKKDKITKNVISAVGIGVSALLTIWGTAVCLQFEKDGTFTSIIGRGMANRFVPKR